MTNLGPNRKCLVCADPIPKSPMGRQRIYCCLRCAREGQRRRERVKGRPRCDACGQVLRLLREAARLTERAARRFECPS